MDDFTLRDLIAMLPIIITALSALAGIWWGLEQRIQKQGVKAEHDRRNTEQRMESKVALLEKELSMFQREVAREYPDHDALKDVEERLSGRIESVSEKMDEIPGEVVDRITQFLSLKSRSQGGGLP